MNDNNEGMNEEMIDVENSYIIRSKIDRLQMMSSVTLWLKRKKEFNCGPDTNQQQQRIIRQEPSSNHQRINFISRLALQGWPIIASS